MKYPDAVPAKKNKPPPSARPVGTPPADHRWWIALGLFLLVLAAFWPATFNGFTNYDDPDYLTANGALRQGLSWEGIRWAFGSTAETANWHPLTWITHLLDYDLYGLEPRGHHLTSVVLHALNAAVLFLFLAAATGRRWRSLGVALLFAVHPLRVESVAWAAERKDVLSGLFFCLSLWAYSGYAQRAVAPGLQSQGPAAPGRSRFYCLSLVLFALGLMCKPMLVTLPGVLLLLDYWPLGRFGRESARRLWAEKIPFFVLSIASGVITLLVQQASGAVHTERPLAVRIQTGLVSYAAYLRDMVWPADLCVHYPYPERWAPAQVLVGALLVAAVTWVAIRWRRARPYGLVGWLWFLGMLVPVLGLVQVGLQARADRYTYLPGIGVTVARSSSPAAATASMRLLRSSPVCWRLRKDA